jgi:hypothetical protein
VCAQSQSDVMSQLKAFLHKAWIVKKRHPGAMFLEIVLPLVFIGLSAVIARFIIRVEIEELPETIKYSSFHHSPLHAPSLRNVHNMPTPDAPAASPAISLGRAPPAPPLHPPRLLSPHLCSALVRPALHGALLRSKPRPVPTPPCCKALSPT